MKSTIILLSLLSGCLAWSQYHPLYFKEGRTTFVQMFEWRFEDIAKECEDFIGPMGYGGVQIPAAWEHVVMVSPFWNATIVRPWYERYQIVNYIIKSRSGDENDLKDMIDRCNKAGVRVYADAVINHMTGSIGKGEGIAGTPYDSDIFDYPGPGFKKEHFHSKEYCGTETGGIDDYDDPWQSRVCELVGLHDLNQDHPHVRTILQGAMNKLISLGIAGFRVDATKHIFPQSLLDLFEGLDNLTTPEFPPGSRPHMFHELSESNRGPGKITAEEYYDTGRILEFRYVRYLQLVFRKLSRTLSDLWDFGTPWNLMPSDTAITFIDNHDIQRGHNGDFSSAINFRSPRLLKAVYAFIFAWPYGTPKVMSSYMWDLGLEKGEDKNDWIGPPHDGKYNIKPVEVQNGQCTGGWICEHRWKEIVEMVKFRTVVGDAPVADWWDGKRVNKPNQIAFARRRKGFVAINNEEQDLNEKLRTTLPAGTYCDVLSGEKKDNKCTGKSITVDEMSWAQISIGKDDNVPAIAIHVQSKLD